MESAKPPCFRGLRILETRQPEEDQPQPGEEAKDGGRADGFGGFRVFRGLGFRVYGFRV